jgi:hypothetical protein
MQKRNHEMVQLLRSDFVDHRTFWRRSISPMVNVRGLGAVGDSVANDRQAFADTDAVGVARGETCFCPAGTYRIATSITLNANWVFAPGAVFDPDGGATVTVNNPYSWGAAASFTPADFVPITRQVIAGAGLTGGGTLAADRTFNVGAGNGITVNTDDVTINLATPSGLSVGVSGLSISLASPSGLEITSGLALTDGVAGDGLTITGKVLAVGAGAGINVTANAVGLNTPGTLSVNSSNDPSGGHTHAITSSSNPGATTSILKSDTSGYLQLVRLGLGVAPTTTLQVRSAAPQLRLEIDGTHTGTIGVDSGDNMEFVTPNNIHLYPLGDVVFDPGGDDILPLTNYDLNLGAINKKYLTLHAAELWVETLVAQETMATIGGRILVGPTTVIEEDMNDTQLFMKTKHNQMAWMDVVYMEAGGKVEFFTVAAIDIFAVDAPNDVFTIHSSYGDLTSLFTAGRTFTIRNSTGNNGEWTVESSTYSSGTLITTVEDITSAVADGQVAYFDSGPYYYILTNRNMDGSGANAWYAGDAVFNTGQAGNGFIDLYSVRGVKTASQAGPTIVGNVRNSATYNDWTEHWAVGNLNGLYGYGVDTYGVGLGKADANNLVLDATNGIRFRSGSTVMASLSSTNWQLGQSGEARITITPTEINFYNGAASPVSQLLLAATGIALRDTAGASVFVLDTNGNYFALPVTLGASGGIWQGTGTFAAPTTGPQALQLRGHRHLRFLQRRQ